MSNDLSAISNQPNVQGPGESGDTSQVDRHPIESGPTNAQPGETSQAQRTGHTSLKERVVAVLNSIKQFFTGRTKRPEVSTPTVTAAAPASAAPASVPATPAEAAGYKTASLMVGETHVELCAKSAETLVEIADILSQPGQLSGEEIGAQLDTATDFLAVLGFNAENASKVAGGTYTAGINIPGYVEGNEVMRQAALRSEQYRANTGLFESCQPTDKARIAGAKALAKINSLLQTFTKCAAKCASTSSKQVTSDEQVAGRKQVMEEFLKIFNDQELQVTTLEWCVGGNNGFKSGGRIYQPLLKGLADGFSGILMDPDGNPSCGRLQELAKDHGHEFVEQLVQTAYRTNDGIRTKLKAAYGEYCTQANKTPSDLEKLLFNDELNFLLGAMKDTTESIKKNTRLSPKEQQTQIAGFQETVEKNFRTWLDKNKKVDPTNGDITIDVGHIKIMVNREQWKEVTLQSLTVL